MFVVKSNVIRFNDQFYGSINVDRIHVFQRYVLRAACRLKNQSNTIIVYIKSYRRRMCPPCSRADIHTRIRQSG